MNKWSLLLFSVLGLLLSTTLELNFVDGRLGCCSRSSRTLFSDTRLSIYEPHCAFTETNQLISPQRDIPYASRNVELILKSGSDGRREKFVDRRNSSDERFRVLSNVVFDLMDSTLSNARDRKALREINGLKLQRTLKFFGDNFKESHVDRSRSRNNDFFGNKMERNSVERGINIKKELSEIWNNRFRHTDEPVISNLKDRKQERFNRRTFVIRTNITPNTRENIDEIRLRFIKKNEGNRDVERSNLDINTKQRLFRDTRLTSGLSKNNDRRFKKVERITQLSSKIDILRNKNIQDYRRLSVREDSIEKMYERASLTDVRRNTDMYGTVNVYRRSYDKDISEEILERMYSKNVVSKIQNKRFIQLDKSSSRSRTIQRENERSGNRIREDERQMNNGFETRLFEKRYSTRHLPRQNSNINRFHEIRRSRFYNDIIIEDGQMDYSNVFIERTKRASDQSRNREIRENNREIRLSEEYMAERITPRNTNCLIEKRSVSSNINKRRSEAFRHSVIERRERDSSRYWLDHDNENNFDQRRIRQIRNSHNEDKLREVRNTQKSMIREKIMTNAMGQEINNIRQIYDDDNVSQRFLVRDGNNKKLVRRLEREHLSSTVKRASQIRINQRDNQNKMHIRAMDLIENRIQADPTFNGRLASNANTNIEKRRARTYNEKSDREFFRNSLVREAELDFDESRIKQVKDKHEYRREYRSNVERTVRRVLSSIDRDRNNVVESGFVNIGKNRIYGTIRSAINVLTRRENYEVRHWSAHENERIFDQRRTRDLLERREDDLSNERSAQRNVAPRNSMNNGVLNKNRRSYNDENDSQVSTNPKEFKRSEKERFSAVIKRSSYLRMIQRDHENRMRNDYTQPIHIQENSLRRECCAKRCLAGQDSEINRSEEDRRTRTPTENLNILRLIRSVDESRISQLRDSREYRLKEKLNVEKVLERINNKIIEKRESRIRHEFDINQNQKTKRTLILLQLRGKDVPSLMRLNERGFEQNGNGIIRNRREFTRIEDYGRNILVAEMRGLRNINERSNIRDTRNKLITRYIATEVEVHDSVETQHERRTERVIRIARHTVSINNRDLREARSEKQRDVNRKLEYVRHYNGLENGVHRENKENVRTSDGDNNRGRDAQDRARDIRSTNSLRISKTVSRITKTRRANEEEQEMRSAFSKIQYLPIEHKTQSDNQILEIKLQYIFYMLQGLYILGLFTKFTINSDGIQKRTRFSNWFPLFSTLKVH